MTDFPTLERQFVDLIRCLTPPTPMQDTSLADAAKERWLAEQYATAHAPRRAEQYRRDPLKCAGLLSDWLHEPEGRLVLEQLRGKDDCFFGYRCRIELDRALLAAAWQDVYDEQLLGESK